MLEIAPNIFYVPGENGSRFPHCACLYLKGRDLRVLIDAGMGTKRLAPVKNMGVDLLVLSHCHIDHRLTRMELLDVPVWCHESEIVHYKERELFFAKMGFTRSGLDLSALFELQPHMFGFEIEHGLTDGERVDLGGMTLETIHTPGHTPGHLSFFIPEHSLLFSGDIDLTPFGPFYGHDFSDIDDFLDSIEKLKKVNADIIATGHAGPFSGRVTDMLDAYGQVIFRRDRQLMARLGQPKALEDFKGGRLFYKYYPDPADLIMWFEMVHIEKHLNRLAHLGRVTVKRGQWQRTP